MKTKSFTLVILVIFGMVIFTNYTSKNTKETDTSSLLFMLEEEKLAHDVYTFLYSKWETRPFSNIKESEKIHMQKVQELLDQNKIPYEILPEGKFKNQNLQKLYNDLTAKGKVSEIEALRAGATIEDVDIYDLQRLTKETQNQDIADVYKFLECASRNHLRAFSRNLEMRNANYVPQYISKNDYEKIINAEHEQCGQQNGMQCQNQGKGRANRGRRNCMNKL
ncbi:MAG: DUF2202 domain-containing protein [Cloacibacterium sp.]|uniref:DUF2202 domain-containing protein n=1 Tax=Cloacibacterium sp. TaxID=1913682 RepID=UPI003C73D240